MFYFLFFCLPDFVFVFFFNIFFTVFFKYLDAVNEGSLKIKQKNGGTKTNVGFLGNIVQNIRIKKLDHLMSHHMLKKLLRHLLPQ